MRSSLYECNVLKISIEELHFVALIHFRLELCCYLCARGVSKTKTSKTKT